MILFYANTSPYARKARLTLIEKGLEARIQMRLQNPFEQADDLQAANPLGKVPALIADDGRAIYDSPVICAFLDSLDARQPLTPAAGPDRWAVMTREALCDGILDAAFNLVMESRRPEEQRSPLWQDRWTNAILRGCAAADDDLAGYDGPVTAAQIALGAALGYLDFRLPELDWRQGKPGLDSWFESFNARPAMRRTDPAG